MLDRYTLRQVPYSGQRPATCEDVDCRWWREGFAVKADERTATGQRTAAQIRLDPTRPRPREVAQADGQTAFVYPPGTRCMGGPHYIERAQLFIPPAGRPTTADLWVEQFGENQQRLSELQARG